MEKGEKYWMEQITIAGYDARIYKMDTSCLADEACFRQYYSRLSPARCKKIDAYHFAKDKRLSLGAGILLDRGLSFYGVREADAAIAFGQQGKPYLPGYPDIHFNLSHSGTMAAAVFADTEAGCDIEEIGQADIRLAERFFCPREYAYLVGKEEGKQRAEAFFRLWTIKESFVKAVGLGLMLPFHSFEVRIGEDGRVTVEQDVDRAQYYFREYRYGNYCMAICLRCPSKELLINNLCI